jgi:hypothetical protein
MSQKAPTEGVYYSYFSIHLGGKFESAGLRIEFHYNQIPGIHFKVGLSDEYKEAILRGLQDGLALHFPEFPKTGSIWVIEVNEHEVDSSRRAFYRVARMVIDQAFSLGQE